jgi:hypothetical protein
MKLPVDATKCQPESFGEHARKEAQFFEKEEMNAHKGFSSPPFPY